MAIIVPEANSDPLPLVRDESHANETTFGGGAGFEKDIQEAQKIAKQTGDLATFERIKYDQAATQEKKAALSGIYTDLLYNPNGGVLTTHGVNSLKAQQDASHKFKKAANDLSAELKGDAQIGAFNQEATQMWESFNKTTTAHAAEEMDKHQATTFQALVKNETERGALAYGDPQTRGNILKGLNTALDQYTQSRGMGPEEKDYYKRDMESNFHEKTVGMMVNAPGFFPAAKEYYYAHHDDINSDTRERIERVLGEGSVRYASQQSVQEILAEHPDSEIEALKAADKIDDADTRDMTRKMLSSRFQQNRAAEKNDQDELFMQWGQKINQSGITDPVDIRNSIPATVWSRLRQEQRAALVRSGEVVESSPKKWLDFVEVVKDGKLVQMSRADLEVNYLRYFDTADKKQAENIWIGSRRGDPKFLNAQSLAQRIDTSLTTSGLIKAKSGSRSEREARLIKSFTDDVVSTIDQYESVTKKSPTPEEMQQIVDNKTRQYFADHMVKVDQNAILPNPQKPIAIMTDSEKGDAYVPYSNVPPKDAATLETLMRNSKKPVSKDKVARAYAAYVMGDRKRLREVINE